jgi:hypothetical protein
MLSLPIAFLAAHLVGDFFFQSDAMATRKSKHWGWLAIHCLAYTSAFVWWWNWKFLLATFVTHFVTDAITSRATSALWFFVPSASGSGLYRYLEGPRRHYFFVVIGVDQFIHACTLAWTVRWVL